MRLADTLTVIAHDRFNDLIAMSKVENEMICAMKALTIGVDGDVPSLRAVVVRAPSLIKSMVLQAEASPLGSTQLHADAPNRNQAFSR